MFQLLVWVWAGLLIGISFIATPAKFLAPSVNLPQALDVGRATFFVTKWLESGLLVILLVCVVRLPMSRLCQCLCTGIVVTAAVQYLGLLPALDTRVALIMQGTTPPHSSLHHIYIALELLKISMLVLAGYTMREHIRLQARRL